MPKNLTSGLLTHLAGGHTKLATFIRIRRRVNGAWDATTDMGFTDYRYPFVHAGLTYYPDDCVDITTVTQAADTSIGSAQLAGVLKSSRITAAALEGGVFRGAEVLSFNLVWADDTLGPEILDRGILGDVSLVGDNETYKVEYRSLVQLLAIDVQAKIQAPCRWTYGDANCGINMTGRRFTATVASVSADGLTLTFNSFAQAAGFFSFSPLKCTIGVNAGLQEHVKAHTNVAGAAQLVLVQPFPFTVSVGDTFVLEQGCDRTWGGPTGCKFQANTARFGGFPQVPGNRKTTQPGIGVSGPSGPWWQL